MLLALPTYEDFSFTLAHACAHLLLRKRKHPMSLCPIYSLTHTLVSVTGNLKTERDDDDDEAEEEEEEERKKESEKQPTLRSFI